MKIAKKIIAIILIINITYLTAPGLMKSVFAAKSSIDIAVDGYTDGVWSFEWDGLDLEYAKSIKVSYHTTDGFVEETPFTPSDNTFQIEDLELDYIYDIYVEIFDEEDGGGDIIGEGLLYFSPGISFYSTRLEQSYVDLNGGGREIGIDPKLNLKWAIPKVWDETVANFVYSNDPTVLEFMQDNINSIYKNNKEISTFNYKINVSTEYSNLNSGSSQASIIIDYNDSGYTAYVSGNSSIVSKVDESEVGFLSIDIIGRADSQSSPDYDDYKPENYDPSVGDMLNYGLPDDDIYPGTVYYMNVKPIFRNSSSSIVNAITVGLPSAQNGSLFQGNVDYTYTPIRFQLSKDDADNVYVKIYKINEGSLDLPRLYYEVQMGDDPSISGDWTVKETMDDTYFSDDYAVTVVTDVNPDNEVYYKIVVKSDSPDDRLESLSMPYTLSDDSGKPPIPQEIEIIDRTLVSEEGMDEKSTDIVISLEKPSIWDEVTNDDDSSNDLYFHILLNTYQTEIESSEEYELEANGVSYGSYPIKYRLVKYFGPDSPNLVDNGDTLEYTLKGFELFKGENDDSDISNSEGYPEFLLPNKVYYMQMYTSTAENKGTTDSALMSYKSYTVSFTTLNENNTEVPLPNNFELTENDADVETNESGNITSLSNYIEIQWDKVTVDWTNFVDDTSVDKNIYYDIYMSTRTATNSFKLIGSTEDLNGDITFIGASNTQSTAIKAEIRNFSSGTAAYTTFGEKLLPNTTYYLIAKTRLEIEGEEQDLESESTSIVSVTTVSGSISSPDESDKKPLAPVDFQIAEDEDGNQILTSFMVGFDWTHQEDDVEYNIICTSFKIDTDTESSEYEDDEVYKSFTETFGEVMLDPSLDTLASGLEYDSDTGVLTYTIDQWISPNKLYYFSIRAINKSNGNTSVWVCIPVTTELIESPTSLEVVQDYEIGFYWEDENTDLTEEDFNIYLKESSDSDYTLLTLKEVSIVKEDSTYFARIRGLDAEEYYDIKVYKGENDETLVYESEENKTNDPTSQIEIKWKGIEGYDYQIAIRTEEDDEYTVLTGTDLEDFNNYDDVEYDYYKEKTSQTADTEYSMFYAKINKAEVTLSDGTTKHQSLKSNTKYYIKVRSVYVDTIDSASVSYSKYVGPVNTRTDFDQDDYDSEEQENNIEAVFLDAVESIESKLYWQMDISDVATNKLVLKGDRLVNVLENNISSSYKLDISDIKSTALEDDIYIPIMVIEFLNENNKSLTLKSIGTEFQLRPKTINPDTMDEMQAVINKYGVDDTMIKVTIKRSSTSSKSLPDNTELLSKVNDLSLYALGSKITYEEMKEDFHDEMYDSDTGLVQEKLEEILNDSDLDEYDSSSEINEYIDSQIEEIEDELSTYIGNKIEGGSGITSIISVSKSIEKLSGYLSIKFLHENKAGLKIPYAIYDSSSGWSKIELVTGSTSGSLTFSTSQAGKYAILIKSLESGDIADDYWAKDNIVLFTSKYDVSEIFGSGDYFYPDRTVSVKEAILLYEKVADISDLDYITDLKQKAKYMGIQDTINTSNLYSDLQRQETASFIGKLYSEKMGIELGYLKPTKNIYIKDENEIEDQYYKPVVMMVDFGIMSINENEEFRPNDSITRAEMITLLVEILEKLGEL